MSLLQSIFTSPSPQHSFPPRNRESWLSASWAPHGMVILASSLGRVQIWDPRHDAHRFFEFGKGRAIRHITAFTSSATAASPLHPRISIICVEAGSGQVWLATASAETPSPDVPRPSSSYAFLLGEQAAEITALELDPKSSILATGTCDGFIRSPPSPSLHPYLHPCLMTQKVRVKRLSPGSHPLTHDRCWDIITGSLLSEFRAHSQGGIIGIGFLGRAVASCGTDRRVEIWDISRGGTHLR